MSDDCEVKVNSMLYACAKHDHFDTAKKMIVLGADVSKRDTSGGTPLTVAAFFGSLKVAKLLIQTGAEIDAEDINGFSPLMLALSRGNIDVAEVLVEGGADLTKENKGFTVRMCAKEAGVDLDDLVGNGVVARSSQDNEFELINEIQAGNVEAVKSILERGTNPNARFHDNCGATALIIASGEGQASIVRLLLDNDADVDLSTRDLNSTALQCASQNGYLEIVNMLLDAGAEISAKTNGEINHSLGGRTALMAAALDGHTEIVKILFDHGASINERKDDGFTPLLLATLEGHVETVRTLVDKGADLSVSCTVNGAEYTALELANNRGHSAVVDVLKERMKEMNEQKINSLEIRAKNGIGEMLISESMKEHFDVVVGDLEAVGATRTGSKTVAIGEKNYIVDQYALPNGAIILAGYEDSNLSISDVIKQLGR